MSNLSTPVEWSGNRVPCRKSTRKMPHRRWAEFWGQSDWSESWNDHGWQDDSWETEPECVLANVWGPRQDAEKHMKNDTLLIMRYLNLVKLKVVAKVEGAREEHEFVQAASRGAEKQAAADMEQNAAG